MALTITEKNHWKDRIAQRIDKRIDQIKRANPKLFHGIAEKAKAEAIKNAKIGKHLVRIAEIEQTRATLDDEKDSLINSAHRELFGNVHSYSYNRRTEIDARIAEHQRQIEEELLKKDTVGREVAELRMEKENLLDTVWLATSPRQVTNLWDKALKLLGEQSTSFQKEILSNEDTVGS